MFIQIPIFRFLSKLRWLQATKSIISGTNTQALTAKADLLKEEMDESMNKVELCKVTSINIIYIFIIHVFSYEIIATDATNHVLSHCSYIIEQPEQGHNKTCSMSFCADDTLLIDEVYVMLFILQSCFIH